MIKVALQPKTVTDHKYGSSTIIMKTDFNNKVYRTPNS